MYIKKQYLIIDLYDIFFQIKKDLILEDSVC